MLAIRLRRTGAKKNAHYRVVVTDRAAGRDGRFLEVLGHYHPRRIRSYAASHMVA